MTNTIMVKNGVGEIRSLYQSLLTSTKVDFVCLATDYESVLGNWYDDEFAPELFKSKVATREIVAETAENRAYGSKKDGVKNAVRYMSYQGGQADLILSDTFAALVSFDKTNPYVVMIKDEELIKSFRAQFSLLWDGAAR